jgi:hypothetical protein
MTTTVTQANPIATSVKRALSRPSFLVAFVVLLVAAMTLQAATQMLRLYFKKEPVPLARQLEQIPASLGPWVQVSVDQTLSHEMLDVLGTKQYIFREYVDSRQVPADVLVQFKDRTNDERMTLLARLQRDYPSAVVRVGVTYYTGMVDTVAHIPDRCYVADGFVPDEKDTPTWTMRNRDGNLFQTTVSSIHFVDSTPARGSIPRNVAYFFHCNGQYKHDAITGVRMALQDLSERHAYYAKVETMTAMREPEKSDLTIQDFLQHLMPEVEKCLPDWQKLKKQI